MEGATAKLRQWREEPHVFVREMFGVTPDAWQDEVLMAFPRHKRGALKASKGPGKSTILAWLAWNFLVTRPHPKVPCASITGDNLRDNLWAELAKWQKRAPLLEREFTWSAERIVHNPHPETWWAAARSFARTADAAKQASALAGIHADYVLFLLDEVGSMADAVIATAEGALASGKETRLWVAGNPEQTQGPLYRICTRERALWYVKEISGDPNDPNRAPRVSLQWAQEQITKYGRDNPWVMINVLGQFPPGQANTLVGLELATQAASRTLGQAEYLYDVKVLGVDVARFGDDRTVLCPRQGRVAMSPTVLRNADTMEVAGRVAQYIRKWQPDGVFIDLTGIGAGVVDRLRELNHDVVGVENAGRSAAEECDRKGDEMWWAMAEWCKHGCIPDDPELISEITTRTYRINSRGKVVLEPKDELKRRGLPSPDKADALALTFAHPVAVRHRQKSALERALQGDSASAGEWDPFEAGRA